MRRSFDALYTHRTASARSLQLKAAETCPMDGHLLALDHEQRTVRIRQDPSLAVVEFDRPFSARVGCHRSDVCHDLVEGRLGRRFRFDNYGCGRGTECLLGSVLIEQRIDCRVVAGNATVGDQRRCDMKSVSSTSCCGCGTGTTNSKKPNVITHLLHPKKERPPGLSLGGLGLTLRSNYSRARTPR